jgi:hypothetical protein
MKITRLTVIFTAKCHLFFSGICHSTGHAPSVVFEMFLHEEELRDGDAVGIFQAFPEAVAGEGNNGFRGEHPCIQKRNDAGSDHAAGGSITIN